MSIAKAWPYWDLQDNIMFLEDGRQVYGVYFEPPSHIHFTPDDLLRRQQTLLPFFDLAVPDGEIMTTYTSLRQALEDDLADTRKYAQECTDEVLRELTLARAEMLEQKILSGEVSHWRFFLTVTVTPPKSNRFDINNTPSPSEVKYAVENAQGLQTAAVAQLAAAGFAAKAMSQQDVFTECFLWLNPGWPAAPQFIPQAEREVHSLRRGRPDHLTFTRQIGASVIDNTEGGGPIVGDKYVEVISLGRLPEYTETGYLKAITEDLQGTYYVVMQAKRENDYDVSNELEKKKGDLWLRVKAPGVVPNGKATNLLAEVEQAQKLDGYESRFEAGVSVVLIAGSRDELERMKRKARGNMARLRAGVPIDYGFQSIAQYRALAPFAGGQTKFVFQPYTSNVIDLFPPVAPWRGFEEGAITFQSRDKSLIKFDLLTPLTKTAHWAVFAPSGSGKTVLALSVLNAHLTKYDDAVLVVTDAKQDFKYYFKSLADSEVIDYGYNSDTRLNIFDLDDGETEPDATKLVGITSFLRLFVSEPDDKRETDYEDVAITEAVIATYKKFKNRGRFPILEDLEQMLNTIENYTDSGKNMPAVVIEAARSVGIRLRKALGSSPLAPLVNCQSNRKLTARRIYLNTFGIPEDDVPMHRVAHHMSKALMWNRAKHYPRHIPKFFYVDEFENQIQTQRELDDIKEMIRVYRSFGVSFGFGTQDPLASQHFGALMDSFSHLFIGNGYSKQVVEGNAEKMGVVEALSLPDVMRDKLPELRAVAGQFSEFALLSNVGGGKDRIGDIIQVEESKLGLWVFASSRNEVTKKEKYIALHGGDTMQGIRQLVQDTYGGKL